MVFLRGVAIMGCWFVLVPAAVGVLALATGGELAGAALCAGIAWAAWMCIERISVGID